MHVQALGICRFSYPSELAAFKVKHESLEVRRAALYDPQRLNRRMFYFEQCLIPSLKAQTDPEFTFLVLIGEQLPAEFRSRLEAAITGCAAIRIVVVPEGRNVTDVSREALLAARDRSAETVAEFRIDDDDAVAVDFIARSKLTFEGLSMTLLENERQFCVDFIQGFCAVAKPDRVELTPVATRYWSCAMTRYLRPGNPKCALDFHHRRVWRRMPTLTVPKPHMYIRGSHEFNAAGKKGDVFATQENTEPVLAAPAAREVLQDRFGIDHDAMQAAWHAHQRKYPV